MSLDFGTLAVLFPLLLLLFGLGFTVTIDPYIQREHRRIMLVIVVLCLSLIAQNLWDNELFIRHKDLACKKFLAAYGYSVRPVILVFYFSSPYTKLCFEIRDFDFVMLRGPLYPACFVVSGILLLRLLIYTLLRFRETRKKEQLIPVSIVLSIIVSVVIDVHMSMESLSVSFLTIVTVVGSVFYYIWLHLQFVREHERDLMAAQRIQIMMTQIQPHFLFNALNTIRALYAKNPPLADKTLEDFSTYLRQNLESLSQSDLIPVSKELEHTRLYAEIEMLRFPSIRIEYQIQDDRFDIPALTIQPLVENAIRHGVRGKKDGLVTVSSVREANLHRITVTDNGKGFDPEKTLDGTHIGLRNVKERVEQMCGGKLILQSEIGKGTCITLLIPDGRKEQKP